MRVLLHVKTNKAPVVTEVCSITYQDSTKTLSVWEYGDDEGSYDIQGISLIEASRIIDEAYKYGMVDLSRFDAEWVLDDE